LITTRRKTEKKRKKGKKLVSLTYRPKGPNEREKMPDSTRLYKTQAAAIRNAEKLNAEYKQLGFSDTWKATQKSNGYWTLTKTEAGKFITEHFKIISY
jgi:hypothetical protein